MASNSMRTVVRIALLAPVAMIAVYLLVLGLFGGDWRAVSAEARSARIELTRPGTLAWSILVDYSYEFDGVRYEKQELDVYRNDERAVTEARFGEWSDGAQFTLYVDAEDPSRSALAADGGAQAMAVFAAILTPLALTVITLIVYVARRARTAP